MGEDLKPFSPSEVTVDLTEAPDSTAECKTPMSIHRSICSL